MSRSKVPDLSPYASMTEPHSFRFESMPRLFPSYWRILVSRKSRSLESGQVPRLEAVLPNARVSKSHLARYRDVCGIPSSDILPIAYLHVLAMPLQMALLTSKAFPVNIIGFVHTRSRLVQNIPLPNDARGELRTWIQGHEDSPLGQEFTLHTQFRFGDEIAWTEECVYLARRRMKRDRSKLRELREKAGPEFPQPGNAYANRFHIDVVLARRYAWIAGDFNPIHLTDATARWLGFDRAIMHGMWSLARCAGALSPAALHRRCVLEVYFKAPARLPTDLVVYKWDIESGEAFALRNSDNQRLHLAGALSFDAPR